MYRRQTLSQPSKKPKLSKDQAIDIAWRKGLLSWKLHAAQKEVYNSIKESKKKIVVVGCARRFGKSYMLLCYAIEECLKTPYIVIKFLAPTAKDIKSVIAQNMREILKDCPKELMPKFNLHSMTYQFPNGSEIQLAGTDNGNADKVRGSEAALCIVDEAGFCDDLNYVVNNVLIPTTAKSRGKVVLISTPSRSPDHPFMDYFRTAEATGDLVKKTIYDNPMIDEEERKVLAEAVGGFESVSFRREFLVEDIVSEQDAVVPEFTTEKRAEIVKDIPAPPFFDSYVSMDIGGRDFTVVLFAYYDFLKATVVVEDELVFKGKILTDDIANGIKEKEAKLWTTRAGELKPVHLRVSDNNNVILLNDLSYKHQINFVPTLKDNVDAALNHARQLIKSNRIVINPRCSTLISHLKGAIWKKSGKEFARSADFGHYDALSAFIYLCRNVDFTKNPYPANYNMSSAMEFFKKEDGKKEQPKTQLERTLVNAFSGLKRNNLRRNF